jgi:hypothetical protein
VVRLRVRDDKDTISYGDGAEISMPLTSLAPFSDSEHANEGIVTPTSFETEVSNILWLLPDERSFLSTGGAKIS